MLTFEEIMKLVGEPVYDKTNECWRVIDGYRSVKNEYCISFTDDGGWVKFNTLSLYKTREDGMK